MVVEVSVSRFHSVQGNSENRVRLPFMTEKLFSDLINNYGNNPKYEGQLIVSSKWCRGYSYRRNIDNECIEVVTISIDLQ